VQHCFLAVGEALAVADVAGSLSIVVVVAPDGQAQLIENVSAAAAVPVVDAEVEVVADAEDVAVAAGPTVAVAELLVRSAI
jgi:hypothetical protein